MSIYWYDYILYPRDYSLGLMSSTSHFSFPAYTTPKFKFSSGALVAEASRWFPKPNVTWLDESGNVLKGSTSFKQNSAGIYKVVSTLQPVNISDTYTYRIENELVSAVSKATVTGKSHFKVTF